MEKRRYIRRMLRMAALAVGMVLTGGASAWGQQNTINMTNVPIRHVMVEDIYVYPGTQKTLRFQDHDTKVNLDGYIRWFVTDENLEDKPVGEEGNVSISQFDDMEDKGYSRYNNGYAWYNDGNDRPSAELCTIAFTFNADDIGKYLVCDASSVFAIRESKTSVAGWNQEQWWELTPRYVSIRHIYRIRNASEISSELSAANTAFDNLNIGASSSISSLLNASNRSACFLYEYDIHVPIESGTNYRLPMRLENYYIGSTPASRVRWRMYGENGEYIEAQETNTNLLVYTFNTNSDTEAQKRYIITEVATNNSEWYPVSFLDITLEPYADAKTKDFLSSANDNYADRKTDELLNSGKYERIVNIQFEEANETVGRLEVNDNFRKEPSDYESYYAFGEPNEYQYRYNNRVSVGRGEYALFRSLNYQGISTSSVHVTSNGNNPYGRYNDFFCSQDAGENIYNVQVVDRLAERTDGGEYGYFMYIDANDYPGVITKIPLSGQTLCANTSLIVSAWICELSQLDAPGYLYAPADVGFTFKRRNRNTGAETILSKFYSGMLEHETTTINGSRQAQWQQVSFKFTIPEELGANEEYLLEISNNSRSSYGADYAIDDIQVLRSLPNISVQRESACEYSTLKVSSDYETLLKNMGWNLNPDVLENADLTDVDIRKFRYGLMGPNPDIWADGSVDQNNELSRYLGNVYFGFVEDPTVTGSDPDHWVTVNKRAMENTGVDMNKYALYKSIRVAVPTNGITNPSSGQSDYVTTDPAEAQHREYMLNVRAMHDFVVDVNNTTYSYWENNEEAQTIATELETALETLWDDTEGDADADAIVANSDGELALYEQSVIKLFNFLGIPRVRCPWRDENATTLYLNAIEVGNTDLHFAGEIIEGQETPADGKYWVVLFSAVDVANAENSNSPVVTVSDDCTLKSEFYVVPSITIAVDTKVATGGVTCVGSIHTLSANLMVADVDDVGNVVSADMVPFDEKYPKGDYTFDWYLGSEDDYNKITEKHSEDLQSIIKKLRDGLEEPTGSFDSGDVNNSSSLSQDEKTLLNGLLGDETHEPLLIIGKTVSFRWVEKLMAIPYVPIIEEDAPGGLDEEKIIKLFCTKPQELTLNAESNVPELSFGFSESEVDYPDDVELFNAPLRLGLRHIKDNASLSNIPIREDIIFGVEGDGHSLRELGADSRALFLRNTSSTYTEVGTLNDLYVDANEENNATQPNELSFTFKEPSGGLTLAELFEEGGTYDLYVPFGEYDASGDLIPNSCEGYAILRIKVVPEYLTWSGKGSTWYNDEESWTISTSDELYEKVDNTVSTPSFSPLYFTKITVQGYDENASTALNELKLKDESSYEKKTLDFETMGVTSGTTSNIQYDMAVGNDEGSDIRPYYGNWVDQIYFKPNATLLNQQHLTYNTAWVDFEMEKGKAYWMASPLKGVYAGDMYAPKTTGRQETEAFTDIEYKGKNEATGNAILNDRWDPAFYQKAWDKAVTYAADATDGVPSDADLVPQADDSPNYVKSNWSIEYNDVTVPYSLGKGFYSRVEKTSDGNALVRLPKKDDEYKYELSTRALTGTGKADTDYGKMADGTKIEIDLSGESVDGDGKHFLVGNPYMSYLNMSDFFTTNGSVVESKYWTIDNGTVVVGTPDVDWKSAQTTGYIAPMTAFFIEVKDNVEDSNKKITFSTSMMEAKPTNIGTRAYTAENPQLTLTAKSEAGASRAAVIQKSDASNQYESDKDAVTLLDSELDAPTVYTVAGNYAAAVNAIHDYKNVPLGVYADADEEVELTIEGASQLVEPLYLYDAVTRSTTPIEGDSYTLNLQGSSHGRYFLTTDEGITVESDIRIYSPADGQLIIASTPSDKLKHVQVYDLSGRVVDSRQNIGLTTCQISVPGGIYIIRAESEHGEAQAKLKVR